MDHWILTWMIFIPLLGAAVVLCLPSRRARTLIRWTASAFTVPPLLLAVWLFAQLRSARRRLPVRRARRRGSPSFNIEYFVGVDGISITMVLLTALLCFLCMLASWGIEKGVKGYFALFLLLETGMMGVFVALDFFLFYVFWEVMLLPMYFLIGIWGGPRREYAAIKFFLYTLARLRADAARDARPLLHAEPHTFDMTKLGALVTRHDPARRPARCCGSRSSSASRSRSRPSRSTPGCPTRTSRRRRRSR